ncbi:electron transfer flavoprotein subunit beta [Photobacterium aquae]|uniref:Electron transfer flavoprotein subunit alpha n=1 Tax=Photobacterium aquae TaxID=1195763 RepID=A0A0J1H0Q0_9GAMM|nr:FAD-binding protein [Photobacterium aquae]KLV05379.1 electron transfer flavoprotein subunit beta [Photobacterium aquae]
MAVLVIAEHDNHALSIETLKAITAAKSVAETVDILVAGLHCYSVAWQAGGIDGVNSVLLADDESYSEPFAESLAGLIAEVGGGYSHILAAATTTGKNILPRAAALLNVGMLADVVSIESEDTVVRPIYAGNALAKVQSLDSIKVMTIRSSAFDPVEAPDVDATKMCEPLAKIAELDVVIANTVSRLVGRQAVVSERPELPVARVVVSGGRGLGSKENFALIEQLADKLGAAIGASRAAVDAGFVSNDLQVGQTGKIVAPDLYIAIGISGAIQHLAGMKESKVIVAINKDPDAPIFEIADYALVGDLFELLPELIEAL